MFNKIALDFLSNSPLFPMRVQTYLVSLIQLRDFVERLMMKWTIGAAC